MSFDEMGQLVDWMEIDWLLAGVSTAAKKELGWPLLALFRALRLATWLDLSDVQLAEALDNRTSFRRLCGFAAGQYPRRTPDAGYTPPQLQEKRAEHRLRHSRAQNLIHSHRFSSSRSLTLE